jgi:ribosomal protein S3
MAIAASMRMNAEGKVLISRLNGAEMARSEGVSKKEESFINFQSDIDYALAEAHTTYGMGIKVWIMKGEVYGREISTCWNGRNKLAEKVEISRGNPTLIKVENQTLVKVIFKLKKMLQPKRTKYRKVQKVK